MTPPPTPPHRRSVTLGVPHGFFGRQGGVSSGPYDSLNVGTGSDDDRAAIDENRERVRRALGADALATVHQTHSPTALILDAAPTAPRPEADAMVTRTPGLALMVLAADCVPVLFAGPGVVGAAHAGWRGSLTGVLEATVAALGETGAAPGALRVAIGPHLRHFEVGDDLIEAVTRAHPEAERYFVPAPARGKHLYDHTGFCRWRLEAAGVDPGRIDDVGGDTGNARDGLFSYRASRRAGEPDYGRNGSAVMLASGRALAS